MFFKPPGRSAFEEIRRGESEYARQLRKVARIVGGIAEQMSEADYGNAERVAQALRQYADMVTPWAQDVARRMIETTAKRERRAWESMAQEMSRELRRELMNAPTGLARHNLLADQVKLIRSLPLEAAEKVHEIVGEAMLQGTRPEQLIDKIKALGNITRNRAELIARTEVARASSTLVQARAEHVGSKEYIWRTSRDGAVRPSHKKMEGVVVRWDSPPTLDGFTAHAGCSPRCRCFPAPVLPNE